MKDTEKKKYINQAVDVFRDLLEKTYLGDDNKSFYGMNFMPFVKLLTGQVTLSRKNDGSLKISGSLSREHFKKEVKGIPKGIDDFNVFPLAVNLLHIKPENDNGGVD